jgi:Lecithin retinol acyltransferase
MLLIGNGMEITCYPVGTILKVRCLSYWHYGMADGRGGVIHNSKKRRQVQFDTLYEFSEGRAILVSSITSDEPEKAYFYAQQYLGTPYNLFNRNCEQFVRQSHGLPVECTQFQRLFVLLFAGLLITGTENRLIKLAGVGLLVGGMIAPAEKRPYRRAIAGARLTVGGAIVLSKVLRLVFRR